MAGQNRAIISAFIDSTDILAHLQKKGVTVAAEAKARVNALSDDEAHAIAEKLDQLPAGGEILGLLFTIFMVLLITDILGFTKVFPFTRSARLQ